MQAGRNIRMYTGRTFYNPLLTPLHRTIYIENKIYWNWYGLLSQVETIPDFIDDELTSRINEYERK